MGGSEIPGGKPEPVAEIPGKKPFDQQSPFINPAGEQNPNKVGYFKKLGREGDQGHGKPSDIDQ